MNKQNFLIISVNDDGSHNGPTFSDIGSIYTAKTIMEYSTVNKYYYAIQSEGLDKSRPTSWSKPFLARKYLEDGYDWIWCIDADVMIMNYEIKLESIVDDNYDVLITCYNNDINHLNTGSIIYKNSEWTKKFLDEIYDSSKYEIAGPNIFFEQSAIIKYYKNNPDEQKHFKMIPTRSINAHYHGGMGHLNVNFEPGDLAVHLAGTDNTYRKEAFEEFVKWKKDQTQPFNVKIWDR